MNIFKLLGHWHGDEFAREIATEFARHCPPGGASDPGRTSTKKLAQAMTTLTNRVAKYHAERRLGWFQKTRLLRAVQDQLRSAGFDEAIIDDVLYTAAVKRR